MPGVQSEPNLPYDGIMQPEVDIACVGLAAYDLSYALATHPGPDEKSEALALSLSGGGPASNAAYTAAKLGQRAAFVGYLARDPFGEIQFAELKDAGVRTDWIVRGERAGTISAILSKPDGTRSIVHRRDQPALSVDQLRVDAIRARAFLFDGHEPDVSLAVLDRTQATTVLDAGSLRPGTRALAPRVDWLVTSRRFATQFSGDTDMQRALSKLAQVNHQVIITLGAEGLIWSRDGQCGHFPAYRVKAVDTTAAGDVFHGAFVSGLLKGLSWEPLLAYASAAAALCCTRHGTRRSLPDETQLEAFLRSNTEKRPVRSRPPGQSESPEHSR